MRLAKLTFAFPLLALMNCGPGTPPVLSNLTLEPNMLQASDAKLRIAFDFRDDDGDLRDIWITQTALDSGASHKVRTYPSSENFDHETGHQVVDVMVKGNGTNDENVPDLEIAGPGSYSLTVLALDVHANQSNVLDTTLTVLP
jgi:hypothetical protein